MLYNRTRFLARRRWADRCYAAPDPDQFVSDRSPPAGCSPCGTSLHTATRSRLPCPNSDQPTFLVYYS